MQSTCIPLFFIPLTSLFSTLSILLLLGYHMPPTPQSNKKHARKHYKKSLQTTVLVHHT